MSRLNFSGNHAAALIGLVAILLSPVLTLPRASFAQERASLSGFVTDAASGETLLLANVVLVAGRIGAATNTSGYFSITGILPGSYTLTASYLGYRDYRETITLLPGEARRLDIGMVGDDLQVDEVVVSGEREEEEEIRRIGVAQLSTNQVRRVPALLEPDVFRSLQLLPGVKAASDYSSGLYIRGGSPDQTLILLDRTTVYNPSHFFGFFSTFNPDAVKDVRLYKGGYPAEYGGRMGSVVDIYNKDGNRVKREGSVGLGLLASRAIVEGPYAKGSWMLAFRRSTLEPLLAALQAADIDGIPERFYFFDLNGKLNLDVGTDDRFSLSFYTGRDKLLLPIIDDTSVDLAYGNFTASGNWTHLFSEKLYSNFTLTSSRYFSNPIFEIAETGFERDNRVYDVSAKGDFEYLPDERHSLRVGFWTGNFTFRLQDTFDGQPTLGERIHSLYTSLYIEDIFRPTPSWMIRAGLRGNYFGSGRYARLEPRLSVEHQPDPALRLQLGYGRYYQFVTLITSELFSGSDIWLTTDDGVPPAYGNQFVAGAKTRPVENLNVDVEVYYRTMEDLFELDPFLPDVAGLEYREMFRFGRGFAYGTELFVEQTRGRINGFVGYTFGVTRRRFPGFEDGKLYAPKYDRRHDLKAVANFDIFRHWRFTGVFAYGSGQAYTEPSRQYKLVGNPLGSAVKEVVWSPFNEARLPPYHRLDIGAARVGRFFGFADYELQLQVLNVYARRNVWFYFFGFEDDNTIDRTEIPQIPVPVPNISFTLTFQ
jgi:hypothetical protein